MINHELLRELGDKLYVETERKLSIKRRVESFWDLDEELEKSQGLSREAKTKILESFKEARAQAYHDRMNDGELAIVVIDGQRQEMDAPILKTLPSDIRNDVAERISQAIRALREGRSDQQDHACNHSETESPHSLETGDSAARLDTHDQR